MTRFFHLANFHSTNMGNGALVSGTERVLREDLGTPLEFVHEPWDAYNFERAFDEKFIDRVNNESDCLLVGGAVAINGRTYLAQSGWRLDLPVSLLERLRVPILIGGISYRFWPGQEFHHLSKFRESLHYLLQHEKTWVGVRNDGTKAWLQNLLEEDLPGVHIMPDPALFVETETSWHSEIVTGAHNILIAFNGEDEEWRFGSAGADLRKNLLQALAATVTRIFAEFKNINLILCPHYLDDFRIMGEFFQYLPPYIAHRYTVASGTCRFPQTKSFYDLYRQADVAIAMRVHSMSPSIGLGVPCVPITSQSRMVDFLTDIGLSDIGLSFDHPDLANLLFTKISDCLQNKAAHKAILLTARHTCRQRIQTFTTAAAELNGLRP